MELDNEEKRGCLGILISIAIVIIISKYRSIQDIRFKEKSIISVGVVYDAYRFLPSKGTPEIKLRYKYKVDNNVYYGISRIIALPPMPNHPTDVKIFNQKTFPLLYDPSNPEKSYLVVTQDDYDRFELVMPDSMKWVREY